jgi:hypothetical protein
MGEDHSGDAAEGSETASLEEGAGGRGATETPQGAQLLRQGPGESGLEPRVEEQLAQFPAASPVKPREAVQQESAATLVRWVAIALAVPMLGAADLVDGRFRVIDHVKLTVDAARPGQAGGDRRVERGPHIDADGLDRRPLRGLEGVVPQALRMPAEAVSTAA